MDRQRRNSDRNWKQNRNRNRKLNRHCNRLLLAAVILLLVTGCGLGHFETGTGTQSQSLSAVDPADIPAYSGEPYVVINDNIPSFSESDLTEDSFEIYEELDAKGRCEGAYANVGEDLMPTEERGYIGDVKPTGWHTDAYDFVDGEKLYNRCHLIGYMLTAENANERNLITGTRYMNTEGMLPFENMVASYIDETGNHVLYRVTPIFEGDNLVASGVLMEAQSVEDGGAGIQFCVYCYNVQPGVEIDYASGDNWLSEEAAEIAEADKTEEDKTERDGSAAEKIEEEAQEAANAAEDQEAWYILNTKSQKFHKPDCSGIEQMSEKNKRKFTGTREELIEQGYSPCGGCNP